jgi:MFS family permease
MLVAGIVLGFVIGVLLGGRVDRLLEVRLRAVGLIFAAVILRYATEWAIGNDVPGAEQLRLPLFALAFAALAVALWVNRDRPGLLVAAAGVTANLIAIIANGGSMPVWRRSLELAGFSPADLVPAFHTLLPETFGGEFLIRAGFFGDIIPVPVPLIANVASVGDVLLSLGLTWFVFSTMLTEPDLETIPVTSPDRLRLARPLASALSRSGIRPETGLRPESGMPASTNQEVYEDALDSPMLLGRTGPGATASTGTLPLAPEPVGVPPIVARIGHHPYVRLALDARFSAFWLGQTISLFGDRLHQIALGILVLELTGSALLTGLAVFSAMVPNLLFGPIAGTFVDRWDQKRVMVVSDVLRAGLVLLLPIAAVQDIRLVYPIAFGVTTVSLFFRPAKAAVLPRIVRRKDLMAANSATWTAEALADIAGFPLAALFVASLGAALPLAFWIDAASYLVSAALILGIAVPPVARDAAPLVGSALRRFGNEMREGWTFLRSRSELFQNTLISAVAQTSVGATLALTVVYARDALDPSVIGYPENYAVLEAVLGIGNLVGGIGVGLIGARLRKGRLIVAGFLAMGAAVVVLGATSSIVVAIAAVAVMGIANLVFIIPTQTLFAELTPTHLMGRVIAMRQTIVFGSLTGAMAAASVLAEFVYVGLVVALFGAITLAAGLMAALLPAVRES